MRRYLSRADFTKLQSDPKTSFERLTVIITDESSQPIYSYNSSTQSWESIVTSTTNPLTGGSILFAAGKQIPSVVRNVPLRVATFGDSTASTATALPDVSDVEVLTRAFPASGADGMGNASPKYLLPFYYPQAHLVANCGISGTASASMLARDALASSTTRKALSDALAKKPDVILFRGMSINDLVGVTPANWQSTADATFANHTKLLGRMLSSGVFVIDQGIYGYGDGAAATATYPDEVRKALLYINELSRAFAATRSNHMRYACPIAAGIQQADGRYVVGATAASDGVHLSFIGGLATAKYEAGIVTEVFGESGNTRYLGENLSNNNFLQNSSAGIATGITLNTTNGVASAHAIESFDDNVWQSFTFTSSAAANTFTVVMAGLFPIASIALNDTIGVEFDVRIEGLNGYVPNATSIYARLDVLKAANGRVINSFYVGTSNESVLKGKVIFQPWKFTDITGISWNGANAPILYYGSDDAGVAIRVSVSNPRMVKI